MNDSLDHLRPARQKELELVTKILLEEFEAARAGKTQLKKQSGKIVKIILFGSFAREDWVEDTKTGYKSDFDILVIVSAQIFCDFEFWEQAETTLAHHPGIKHDVDLIVEPLAHVNDMLAEGQYFFSDIRDQGIALYEASRKPLLEAKLMDEEAFVTISQKHFEKVFPYAQDMFRGVHFYIESASNNPAAFLLHQATEHAYGAFLLTYTHYKPDIHHIGKLRSLSENIDADLISVWPRNTRLARRRFELLRRAYVEARYSEHYEIAHEDLDWLTTRVTLLHERIEAACKKRLEI